MKRTHGGPPAYDASYYSSLRLGMRASARSVAPLLAELFAPRSVVDVGCGPGEWLAAFGEQGVGEILGIDGDHIDRDSLAIPSGRFLAHDLREPLRLDQIFDLVLCLEVAEHLPPDAADVLVESLTRLGDVVVFSAAIPHQGGEHHVNEQWPEYWRQRFQARGYAPHDDVRWRIWNDADVEWWYAQNLLVFTAGGFPDDGSSASAPDPLLPVVHPRLYLELCEERRRLEKQLWMARVQLLERSISAAVPKGAGYALIGGERLEQLDVRERRDVTPQVGASPRNIAELMARAEGFGKDGFRKGDSLFIVLAWPYFWLLEGASEEEGRSLSERTILRNEACAVVSLE